MKSKRLKILCIGRGEFRDTMCLEYLCKSYVENSAPGKSVMSRQRPDLFHDIRRVDQLPPGVSTKKMAFSHCCRSR